ncbi:MAG: type II toxin-antitoxin system PemK/MazF family toxin [Dermatophilaceae bacterium]
MRRGDVYLVDLTADATGEPLHPAVVVSNDGANVVALREGRGPVTIVPISTNTRRVLPFHAYLPAGSAGLERNAKALAEQVRTVDGSRLARLVGHLAPEAGRDLDRALRLHLGL